MLVEYWFDISWIFVRSWNCGWLGEGEEGIRYHVHCGAEKCGGGRMV